MNKKILLFLCFLLITLLNAPISNAQGAAFQGNAFQTITPSGSTGLSGPIVKAIPSAIITVCNGSTLPSPGSVCTGIGNIYSCISLSACSLSNPTNADANGNFFFYATAGQAYVISISGSGVVTYSYVWTAPLLTAAVGANVSLSNLSSVNINTSLLPQTGVDLGSASQQFRNLYLFGSGVFGTNYFAFSGTPTAVRSQVFQDVSDTFVYRNSTDILQNKTLQNPSFGANNFTLLQSTANYTVSWSNPVAGRVLLIPDPLGNDTFAFLNATQTFLNKTLTSPVLTTPVINGASTGTGIQGTDTKLLTAGTISGTGALCADSNGGATNSGCVFAPVVQQAKLGGSTCTTAAASFATCNSNVTFSPAFANTSYTVVCSGVSPSDPRAELEAVSISSASVVTVTVVTNGATAVNFGDVYCIGVHP